jgi:four helix bundle protein
VTDERRLPLDHSSLVNREARFDLEHRTFTFAKDVRFFVKQLTRTMANIEDGSQLIRSSGSVGANYVEANESLSRKDFILRIKICRKEARESAYWLKLIDIGSGSTAAIQRDPLVREAHELTRIFTSIVQKVAI